MPEITNLPILPSSANTDLLPVQQGGITYRGTRAQILLSVQNALDTEIATTDVEITTLQNNRVLKAGDVMTGLLTLSGAPTADLHATTRLYVNSADALRLPLAGGTMTGAIAMGTNPITGVGNPTAAQDVSTQNYVITTTAKTLEAYSPVATSEFPVTYGAEAITTGDRFNITAAGVVGPAGATVTVQIGDVIEALTNVPANIVANWAIYNANTITASTTAAGISELATDAETLLLTATDRVITASNLGALNTSETQEGLVELATAAEFTAGADATRAITPAVLNTNQTDYQEFIGLQHVLAYSAGTWTRTRIAAGDYVQRKTAAADTTIIGIDISKALRTAASRGFRLDNIGVIYRNNTADLVAHSITLWRVAYTDVGAVTPVSIPVTGTLLLTQNANPRLINVAIDTPIFNNNSDSKYICEVTVNAALTSAYDWIGLVLKFAKSGI